MRVYVQGSNQAVDLTQRSFVAGGGQGNVYARGDTSYKVYHDPREMVPVGKIQELSRLTDPRVIRPQQVLVDAKGTPVGFTARFVEDAVALCQIFPRAFREREGVTHDVVQGLVRKLQEGVAHVHASGILIVDLNEMNFLVAPSFDEVYFIDVDSYQTPHYPASALMESVRDWTVRENRWTALSDWFSFGVVAFQMFTGIHPYKGGYVGKQAEFKQRLPSDKDDDVFAVTRRRMRARVSVFHADVRCPAAIYPFDVIPAAYRAWFEAVLADGKRCAPPQDFGVASVMVMAPRAVEGTAALDVVEVGSYSGDVRRVWSDGGKLVVAADGGVWVDKVQVLAGTKAVACAFTPRALRAVVAEHAGQLVALHNVTDRAVVPFSLAVQEVCSYDGRLYARTFDQVHEVVLTDAGTQVVASSRAVVNVLPHATRLYPGVVVQNMLGSVFVSLLTRAGEARQVRVPELDKVKVVEARYDRGVLMVVSARGGRYSRAVFRFADDDSYDVRVVDDVAITGLNFVTLDSGVCVCLNEEEKFEIFSAKKGSTGMRVVDGGLGGDVVLGKMGGTLLAARGNKVYQLKMK